MKKYLIAIILLLVFLCGCETVPKYWEIGREGYISPEGVATRTAVETAAKPFVGEPWATILGTIGGLFAGGYAVYKRRQWLDTPTESSES